MSRIEGPPGIPSRKKAGAPQSAQNEIQAIIYAGAVATSGSFKASVQKPDGSTATTASLAFNATHTSLIAALVAAGATGVIGTTNPTPALINSANAIACYVTFSGAQGNQPLPLITVDGTNGGSGGLVGGTLTVMRVQAGYAGDFVGAAVGDLAQDTTTGILYRNIGTPTAPLWTPTPPFLRGGNTLVCDGDSITYHNADAYDFNTLAQGGQSYPTPMIVELDGAVRLVKIAAYNGNNTSHLLAHFEAEVLPYLPSFYLLLCGINDQGASYATSEAATVAAAVANIAAIFDKCFRYGIQPIVSTILPNSQTSFVTTYGTVTNRHSYIARFNAALKAMVANYPRKVYLLDPHYMMSDLSTGSYNAAYTTDLLHPNGVGQSVLGNFYAAELVKIVGSDAPQQWLIDTVDQGPNAIANGLFAGTTVPTSWSAFGSAATNSCVAPPTGVPGQAAKIVPPASQSSGIFQDVSSSAALGYAAGDHMLVAGRILTSGMTTSGQVSVSAVCQVSPNVTTLYTVAALNPLTPANYPTLGRFQEEFVIPTGCGNIRVLASGVGDTGGTAYVEYMQFTLINLTRLGYPTAFPASEPRH